MNFWENIKYDFDLNILIFSESFELILKCRQSVLYLKSTRFLKSFIITIDTMSFTDK